MKINDMLSDIVDRCNNLLSVALSATNRVKNSKEDACNRLKLILMHDRSKLSPAELEQMRAELIEVISKYVEIDKDALDLNLASESNSIALMASIPVLRTKKNNPMNGENKEENEETINPFADKAEKKESKCDCGSECTCGCQDKEATECTCENEECTCDCQKLEEDDDLKETSEIEESDDEEIEQEPKEELTSEEKKQTAKVKLAEK